MLYVKTQPDCPRGITIFACVPLSTFAILFASLRAWLILLSLSVAIIAETDLLKSLKSSSV
jgi:hypothetical protein